MMPADHAAMVGVCGYEAGSLIRRATDGPDSFPPPLTQIVGEHPWTLVPFTAWMIVHMARAVLHYAPIRRRRQIHLVA